LFAAACAPHSLHYADAASPPAAHALHVLAGDHLVIDGRSIVLADAETPQPGSRAHCRAEAVAADQLKHTVRGLLAEARFVETAPKARGRMGLVHLDGLDLGLMLISRGLAAPRRTSPMNWCARL
jgi:hypothetical protein